jgi:hypothetical protein
MQRAFKLEALLSRCRKLRYYSQFVPEFTEEIHLFGVYDSTDHDGDKHVYQCASVPHAKLHGACLDLICHLLRYLAQ